MSGRHLFSELTKDFSEERRSRVEAIKSEMQAEMALYELRRARSLSQKDLAKRLDVNQPAIAKMERRTDVYVSSLRSYVEAAGGRLKIIAEFPDGEIAISNFSSVGEPEIST